MVFSLTRNPQDAGRSFDIMIDRKGIIDVLAVRRPSDATCGPIGIALIKNAGMLPQVSKVMASSVAELAGIKTVSVTVMVI